MSMNLPQELDGGSIDETKPGTANFTMDTTDKALLSIIQSGFPLVSRPYAELGDRLGISEDETLERVKKLRQAKVLRRLGANFQSAALGFKSSLCAAKVPEDKLELFIAEVNKRAGATHNYLRDHAYNIWFTLIAQSWEHLLAELHDIEQNTGIKPLNLPATRLYKIKVDFKLN